MMGTVNGTVFNVQMTDMAAATGVAAAVLTAPISEVLPAIERSGLIVTDIEILRLHYAETLKAWRERFLAQLPAVRAQGFDERFIRLWEFYLAYCEGGFLERSIGVSHLLMARPGHPEAA